MGLALLTACSSAFCAYAMEGGEMGDFSAEGAFSEDELLIDTPSQADSGFQTAEESA